MANTLTSEMKWPEFFKNVANRKSKRLAANLKKKLQKKKKREKLRCGH